MGIGQEVRDGKFVFVVTEVSTSANWHSPQQPPGCWVIATLTVHNVDGNSHSFAANCQKLIDSTGREYDAGAMATIRVNSGATITAEVPFDVPAGARGRGVRGARRGDSTLGHLLPPNDPRRLLSKVCTATIGFPAWPLGGVVGGTVVGVVGVVVGVFVGDPGP